MEHLSSGNQQFSTADRVRFQQYTRGELQHDPSLNETPTDRIITERLLCFKNIQELQAQNESLLKVTRDLAVKLEDDERKAQEELAGRQSQEVEELKKALDRYRDELKAMNTKSVVSLHVNVIAYANYPFILGLNHMSVKETCSVVCCKTAVI